MTAVVARIALRYIAGVLVGYGYLSSDLGSMLGDDPDVAGVVEMALGVVISAATELGYYAAKRYGWTT
jgi:hypothetical protein